MRIKRWMPWTTLALAAVCLSVVAGGWARGLVQEKQAKPAAPAAAKKLKVGIVTDIGGLNDRGFNALAYKGLQRAVKTLKVQGRVLTSKGPNDYIPNFTSLVRQRYDLIIGVGFLQTDSMNTMGKQFPKSKFAIVDVSAVGLKNKPKNVQGILFREQEAGYLAGYLAALVSTDAIQPRRVGAAETIGWVGGLKIPPVDRFGAGYKAGAQAAVPGTKVIHGYSQDFVDQAKCKEIALNQADQGAKVIFQVAGGCGLGALDAALEKGVWGIGVDNDQAGVNKNVLTSATKRVDQGVYLTIKTLVDRKFKGGRDVLYGVKNGGVGLGKIHASVPADIRAKVKARQALIAAGKIKIPTIVP
ncbi:MAG: BMP family protein [Gaiellaceae bacterium]